MENDFLLLLHEFTRLHICSSVFRKAVNSRDGKRGPSPKQPEGAPLDTEAADAAAGLQLPSGHTNTIDDEAFFENLPSLLADVNDRLGKLMDLEGESLQKLAKLDATGEVPPVDTEKAESEGRSKEDDDEEDPGAAEGDGAGAEAAQEGAAQAAANAGDDMGAVADANAAAEAAADGEALDADARSQSAADGGEGAGAARDSVASGAPGSDTAQDAQAASEALAGADAAAHAEADAQTATAVPDADAAPKMSAAARASIGDHEVAAGELPLTEADRVLQQRSSEAPVHERTVLDALFEDNSQDVEEEIERRMAKMNKGMKKCALGLLVFCKCSGASHVYISLQHSCSLALPKTHPSITSARILLQAHESYWLDMLQAGLVWRTPDGQRKPGPESRHAATEHYDEEVQGPQARRRQGRAARAHHGLHRRQR